MMRISSLRLMTFELKDSIQIEDLGWKSQRESALSIFSWRARGYMMNQHRHEFVSNEELTGETAEEGGWESD